MFPGFDARFLVNFPGLHWNRDELDCFPREPRDRPDISQREAKAAQNPKQAGENRQPRSAPPILDGGKLGGLQAH